MPIFLGIIAIVLDQLSKFFCTGWLTKLSGGTFPIIQDVLHLTYVENRGAAFGFLQDAQLFFIIITIVFVGVLAWFLIKQYKSMGKLMQYSLCLITAGAIGNFIDRVAFSYVRDMIDFRLINFAVFNVADSAITIGVVLLIIDIMFFHGMEVFDKLSKDVKRAVKKID